MASYPLSVVCATYNIYVIKSITWWGISLSQSENSKYSTQMIPPVRRWIFQSATSLECLQKSSKLSNVLKTARWRNPVYCFLATVPTRVWGRRPMPSSLIQIDWSLASSLAEIDKTCFQTNRGRRTKHASVRLSTSGQRGALGTKNV